MNQFFKKSIGVLITTFSRPAYLKKCLDSIRGQTLQPAQVIVVVRKTDQATQHFLETSRQNYQTLKIEIVSVTEPGVIAANNAAYPFLKTDIVAFLDDDSIAPPEWLQKLFAHYSDSAVGAAGGLIRNYRGGIRLYENKTFKKYSQRIDYLGFTQPGQMYPFQGVREVDFLAGGNMSFRRNLLPPCDAEILGDGYAYEIDLCLIVKRMGYKIILDSAAANDHYSAPRKEGPERLHSALTESNNRYNEAYVLAKHNKSIVRTILTALFYRLPRDIAKQLLGRHTNSWHCLRGSLRGVWNGQRLGRQRLQEQLQQLSHSASEQTDFSTLNPAN